jgi:hypothetical protein
MDEEAEVNAIIETCRNYETKLCNKKKRLSENKLQK